MADMARAHAQADRAAARVLAVQAAADRWYATWLTMQCRVAEVGRVFAALGYRPGGGR